MEEGGYSECSQGGFKSPMKIKGHEPYWVLLCDDSAFIPKSARPLNDALICGVYSSKKEAQKAGKEIQDCMVPHKIKRCTVTIEIL